MTSALQPRPAIGAPVGYRFPAHEAAALANGLAVETFHLPGQQVIAAHLVLDIPLNVEERQHEGVATLALDIADEGTRSHPGASIAELLEDNGAALGGRTGNSASIVELTVPRPYLAEALKVMAEIVTEPAYAADDVRRHVALRHAEIDQTLAVSARVAALAFQELVFDPDSRPARPRGGLHASVETLDDQLVRGFHDQWWQPSGATLVIAGDLPSDVVTLVEAAFGGWRSTGARPAYVAPSPARGPRRIAVIDRPEAVQADVRIGGFAIDRTDPRWAAAKVASVAVGGSFLSRLNRVLREERGYTYGAHFGFAPHRSGGTAAMSSSFRTEVAAAAIAETLQLLDVEREPISADEVRDAQNYLLGVAPLHYDTADAIAAQAAALIAAGVEPDFIDAHHAAIAEVNASDANAAFSELVRPADQHVVVCGRADELLPGLKAVGLEAESFEVTS